MLCRTGLFNLQLPRDQRLRLAQVQGFDFRRVLEHYLRALVQHIVLLGSGNYIFILDVRFLAILFPSVGVQVPVRTQ